MKFKPQFAGNPGECSRPLSLYFLCSFLVFTCLPGVSMLPFNRHFRIQWPTHNFDFLTCPCLVFLFSVNGLTIWPVIQTKVSHLHVLPVFSLLPCQTYQVQSTLSPPPAACLFESSALGQASILSLGCCNSRTTGLSVSILASLQCLSSAAASVFVDASHPRTHLLWPLCVLLTLVYKSQHDLDPA